MKEQLIKDVVAAAKEKHGDNWLAYLWGASQVLLKEEDLQIILDVLEDK
jgi:hypothetical protein